MGKRLMQLAEEEALARGCHGVLLDTHAFQARSFYELPGYVQFAGKNVHLGRFDRLDVGATARACTVNYPGWLERSAIMARNTAISFPA